MELLTKYIKFGYIQILKLVNISALSEYLIIYSLCSLKILGQSLIPRSCILQNSTKVYTHLVLPSTFFYNNYSSISLHRKVAGEPKQENYITMLMKLMS